MTSELATVGISYARKCPLACRHCIAESSPKAQGKMSFDRAADYLRQIPEFSQSVGFTGGEPLLYYDEIVALIRIATDLGLSVSIITSAAWAVNEELTRRKVRELRRAGLGWLGISWDEFHKEFQSVDRPRMLARVAVEEGLPVTVRTLITANQGPATVREEFEGLPVEIDAGTLIQLGSASKLPPSDFCASDAPTKGPCLSVPSVLVEHSGDVFACCGPSSFSSAHSPLRLGNAESEPLSNILRRAMSDPLLEAIGLIGPHGLLMLLESDGESRVPRRSTYSSICDLCLDLTNSPDLVALIRRRLGEPNGRRMLAAARIWFDRRIRPELIKRQRTIYKRRPVQ
jgi:hypothetical protein